MKRVARKILGVEELKEVRAQLKQSGKSVVQCHGCFDVVHPGHLRYLQFAREQGDTLVVSISADDVVGKGPDRPYINEDLRAENIAAFEFVDYVVIDRNTWAGPILEAVKPDVYVKGKEYESSADTRFARERALVEEYGGKVIFSSGDVVYSSSFLITHFHERMRLERDRVNFFCRRHGVTRQAIDTLVRGMKDKRVLVLGDAILDRYVHGEALGIAAESPILSVTPVKEESYLGAGALIAKQAVAFGGEAGILSAFGDNASSELFKGLLERAGIRLFQVPADDRPVYVKTRYLVDGKKVFKVDEGRRSVASTKATREMISSLERSLDDYDALVVTDFGYGLLGAELIAAIAAAAEKRRKPYFVDVSHTGHANVLKFPRPTLATPTEAELRFAFGDNESGLSNLAAKYFSHTSAERLVLTMGRRGLIMFENAPDDAGRLPTDYLPALSSGALDEVGAGDVLLATLVLARLAGGPHAHGVYLASVAAAIHVNRIGNDPVELTEVLESLEHRDELG